MKELSFPLVPTVPYRPLILTIKAHHPISLDTEKRICPVFCEMISALWSELPLRNFGKGQRPHSGGAEASTLILNTTLCFPPGPPTPKACISTTMLCMAYYLFKARSPVPLCPSPQL